ncbi:MAG: hypothetical protein SOI62_01380 [Lactobacillus sp.]
MNVVIEPVISELLPRLQGDFIEDIKKNSANSRTDLVNFIVFNRFAFLKQNRQVIRIVLQELLTKPDFVGEIVRAFQARLAESPRLVESNLGILLEKHPEYQPMDLLRIIAGPLVAYFMQRFVFFPDREFAEERDLKLIAKQILLILN